MDDVEQFSRALSAIAQAGAYSAKDIRQICAQEVQYVEETVLWADNVPYAVVRTPTVQVPVYERSVVSPDIQEKDCRPNSKLDSWPYRVVAFLNEVIDIFRTSYYGGFPMRCCPVCYSKVRPTVCGTVTAKTSLEIKYKIQCRHCGFGCDKAGSVTVQYDEETMNPIADDHGLRKLIRDWDSILRDPERERIANI